MRYSKDGGKTWSDDLWRSFGKMGDYDKRVKWNIGSIGQNFVFDFTATDPVPVTMLDASAMVEVLDA